MCVVWCVLCVVVGCVLWLCVVAHCCGPGGWVCVVWCVCGGCVVGVLWLSVVVPGN